MKKINLLVVLAWLFLAGCVNGTADDDENALRDDGACRVNIALTDSLQNPAWSPDGQSILLTVFENGYNQEPADLFIVDLESNSFRVLVSDGSGNINLPGSVWNPTTRRIVFSSSRGFHDEIFSIDENGSPGEETQITQRENRMAYEPSFSPDGQFVVFESHMLDVEENGVIATYRTDGAEPYQTLTGENEDCRQPNWSPAGDLLVYQKFDGGQWDIWVMRPDGTQKRKVTSGAGDKTDASFSPDGKWLVYSADGEELEFANLFIRSLDGGDPLRVTFFDGYDGAPSWSPDGNRIVFESSHGDPDESSGTAIWMIDVPEH